MTSARLDAPRCVHVAPLASAPVPYSLTNLKSAYTDGLRRIAPSSMTRLGRTRLTPTMLTTAGVSLCAVASVIVYFEYKAWWLFLVGAAVFALGSFLDILDGALARTGGLVSPFGAFLDSMVDRVGEAFMLGAIVLVLMRDGNEWGVAVTVAALAGSFLVSYTRAKAEQLGARRRVTQRAALPATAQTLSDAHVQASMMKAI